MTALLILTAGSASAQRLAIWTCTLPGGTFEVSLRAVTAISSHEYTVEGGIKVTEVVIETTGASTENRFYYMESPTASAGGMVGNAADALQSRAQTAADHVTSTMGGGTAVSDAMNTTVVKTYPTTTHAHTVEYRLASEADLTNLFNSIQAAWTSNTNTSFSPTAAASGGSSTTSVGQ